MARQAQAGVPQCAAIPSIHEEELVGYRDAACVRACRVGDLSSREAVDAAVFPAVPRGGDECVGAEVREASADRVRVDACERGGVVRSPAVGDGSVWAVGDEGFLGEQRCGMSFTSPPSKAPQDRR